MQEVITQIIDFLTKLFNQIGAFLVEFWNAYKVISIILLVITIIFFLVKFFSALVFDLTNVKIGVVWLSRKIWFILKLPFIIIYWIIWGIVWLCLIPKRRKHIKELKESVFNVIPKAYKIPFFKWLFSHKIRKQNKFRLKCIEKCISTQDLIDDNFKYITMIEASVGGGKTSFLNGYSHMRTLILKEQAEDSIADIEKKLFYINFQSLRYKIKKDYEIGSSEIEIYDSLMRDEIIAKNFSGTFTDYISEIPKENLLKQYIKGYSALLRDNYVLCNYKLFNRITNKYNYDLNSELFNIRDENARKSFFIPSYCVIIDDEKALSDLKNTNSAQSLDKKGDDVVLRLLRQLREETTFYISSTQNTSRIAMLIRELANTYVRIESYSIIGEQNHLANYYRKVEEKTQKKIEKTAKRKYRKNSIKQEKYLLTNNKLKAKIFKYFQKQKELFASAFVKYKVRIASKLEFLNDDEKSQSLELVFPLTFVYGVYRTCEYADFYEFLNGLSDIKSDHQLKVIESLFKDEDSTNKYEKLIANKTPEKKKKGDKQTHEKI